MALSKDSCITLNDGHKMPIIALGTYSPDDNSKEQLKEAIKVAIKVGYRHIDGAYVYGNEESIGPAIQEKIADGTVKREDLFYTGKLWNTFHKPEFVQSILKRTLKALQLNYINLYLIHWPVSLKALEACKDAGLVKSIGVSNFNRRQLEMILNKPGLKYKPVCNQVECHPFLTQKKLLEFCKMNDIVLVGYSVLGSINVDMEWRNDSIPPVLHDPVVTKIAEKYNKSPAQVSIRYIIQRGIVAIAKSFTPKRIEENFQVFDFQLTEEDMKLIDGLNKNLHYWEVKQFSEHPEYPFHEEY
ncbi:aldo-keto reductase family 1 member C3 isoform X2 [Microcaecilia unicolor]|uniref:Aldo-keto reductase family 1 member C3-like isoform X2 n=1 Tax=Microcaecilia unicolor TaxID=1415580 RepID=A0A6P7Z4F0_9AMPH|nr:aldo-keto reductase family 1 member C3-like isoform X2 [Microcaecilia unicolor]